VLLELQLMELATMTTPLLVLTLRTLVTKRTLESTAICQEIKTTIWAVMQHLLAELALLALVLVMDTIPLLLALTLRTLPIRQTQESTAICQETKTTIWAVMQHLLAELALPVLELTKLDTLLTRTQTPFPQATLGMETPQRALTHPTWPTKPILEWTVTDPRITTMDVTLPSQAESAQLDTKPTSILATMTPQPTQTQQLVLTPQI